jgi:hypothetical protein
MAEITANNMFTEMPQIPYKILVYLIEHNENLFKLLKYNTQNPFDEPNLTKDEKIAMLYTEKGREIDYNIFFKPLIGEEMVDSVTQLRFYKARILPSTKLKAVLNYEFDIVVGSKTNLVYDENGIPCSRLDLIEHEILDTLCGINEFGAGGFQFSRELSNLCVQNTSLSNSKSFFCSSFVLACNWVELNDYGCE